MLQLTRAVVSELKYRVETVQCKDWGVEVRLREMTAGRFQRYQEALKKLRENGEGDSAEVSVSLLQNSIVDFETEELLFADAEGAEILRNQGISGLVYLAEEAMRINNMSQAKIDEAAENFENGQSEDSSSD